MKFMHPVVIASAMGLGSAAAIDPSAFEGGVLEARQGSSWTVGSCYSSSGDLKNDGQATYQSSYHCEQQADANNAKVIALFNGDTCFYGNDLPPDSAKVDSSNCNVPCQGYNKESCGGSGAYLVWTLGTVSGSGSGSSPSSSPSSAPSSSPSPSPPSSSPPAQTTPSPTAAAPSTPVVVSTIGGTTIIITPSADAANSAATVSVTAKNSSSGSSGANKGAIAAGVVVGVVGFAAIAGGAFLFLRSKKQRREAAELHRQNSSAGFASRAEKPPSTFSNSDARLEPAFMRRMSDGSIADNQDYSRRILKVTNPDDR